MSQREIEGKVQRMLKWMKMKTTHQILWDNDKVISAKKCIALRASTFIYFFKEDFKWLGFHLKKELPCVAQMIKNLASVQETQVQSWSGRSPREGQGNTLQFSCLENSMNCGVHGVRVRVRVRVRVSKSRTWLSDFHCCI